MDQLNKRQRGLFNGLAVEDLFVCWTGPNQPVMPEVQRVYVDPGVPNFEAVIRDVPVAQVADPDCMITFKLAADWCLSLLQCFFDQGKAQICLFQSQI
jgi:hypothetical protein